MKVLSTRRRPDGLVVVRRIELDNGERVNTYELPEVVVRSIGMKKINEIVEAHLRKRERDQRGREKREARVQARIRGDERRRKAQQLREAVAARPGEKSLAIAIDLGISDRRVRTIRKELGSGQPTNS